MRTDHIQDERGRGYGPSRLDRLSLWLAGETGLGMLMIVGAVALLGAAFVLGLNVGYDMALVGMGQQAQEVLR